MSAGPILQGILIKVYGSMGGWGYYSWVSLELPLILSMVVSGSPKRWDR